MVLPLETVASKPRFRQRTKSAGGLVITKKIFITKYLLPIQGQ
jgi:hypothetical protein